MIPIRDIKREDIRGVVYLDAITKGQVDGIKFYMINGDIHEYHGENLALALTLAKERFRQNPPERDSN